MAAATSPFVAFTAGREVLEQGADLPRHFVPLLRRRPVTAPQLVCPARTGPCAPRMWVPNSRLPMHSGVVGVRDAGHGEQVAEPLVEQDLDGHAAGGGRPGMRRTASGAGATSCGRLRVAVRGGRPPGGEARVAVHERLQRVGRRGRGVGRATIAEARSGSPPATASPAAARRSQRRRVTRLGAVMRRRRRRAIQAYTGIPTSRLNGKVMASDAVRPCVGFASGSCARTAGGAAMYEALAAIAASTGGAADRQSRPAPEPHAERAWPHRGSDDGEAEQEGTDAREVAEARRG